MNLPIRIFKFGGASIKDAAAVRNITKIIQKRKEGPLLIVVSAMAKMTNALEGVAEAYFQQTGRAEARLQDIKQWHYRLMLDLFGSEDHEIFELVNDIFVEVEWVLDEPPQDSYDYIYDQIVATGELVSSRIVGAYFNHVDLTTAWVDARDLILTDEVHRAARVQWEQTQTRCDKYLKPKLTNQQLMLTQGFIGSTSENNNTTLGREGSDYSAAVFTYCLGAESMTIWKDVPGVMNADPRVFENVTKLEHLSYREAIEMSYYGAKVIHPKTIKPLQNLNIPLYVKSFRDPYASGTIIGNKQEEQYPPIVTIVRDQALIHIATRDFSFVAEQHMSVLFQHIAELRLQVNILQNTAISFSISVNDVDDKVQQFVDRIEHDFSVRIEKGLELITVRHFQDNVLANLKRDKIVLLEQRIRNTVQMVVRDVAILQRKKP